MTPWAIFLAIYLTQKNVSGISAGTPKQSISLIFRQTCVIKKSCGYTQKQTYTALSKINHHFVGLLQWKILKQYSIILDEVVCV